MTDLVSEYCYDAVLVHTKHIWDATVPSWYVMLQIWCITAQL